jgi:hypothetical protein
MNIASQKIEPFSNKFNNCKSPINLSQSFQGLLFTQPIQYLQTKDNQVMFHAAQQVICICNRKKAYLHSKDFLHAIAAKIDKFNLVTGELVMEDFCELDNIWKMRKQIRLSPFEPLMVNIITQNKKYRGNFDNISLDGAAILLHSDETRNLILNSRQNIIMQFLVPNSKKLCIQGQIINLQVLDNHLLRVGVKTFLTANEKTILINFIHESYDATINIINDICCQILGPPQIKDLYF